MQFDPGMEYRPDWGFKGGPPPPPTGQPRGPPGPPPRGMVAPPGGGGGGMAAAAAALKMQGAKGGVNPNGPGPVDPGGGPPNKDDKS